ncbi:MAG: tetratricopeptide repeat protein [Elusimicrobiota bacterium]
MQDNLSPHDNRFYKSVPFILLALLFLLLTTAKIQRYKQITSFQKNDDTAIFWSEAAVHYRYAKMWATGQKPPENDLDLQFPEGLKSRQEMTLLMEFSVGSLYRIFNLKEHLPFHEFLMIFMSFWATLSLFAVFDISLSLWRNTWVALASAVLYGLCRDVFLRSIGQFEYEQFALPLFFGGLAMLLAAIQDDRGPLVKKIAWSLAAGALLTGSLMSWHFSRFLWLALAVSLAPLTWCLRKEEQDLPHILLAFTLCVTTLSLLSALLRHQDFLLSPGQLFCYALIGSLYWQHKGHPPAFARRFLIPALPWLFTILVLLACGTGEGSTYQHVWQLLAAKLHFGLTKPNDPLLLPPLARILWVGPFDSPMLNHLLLGLGPLIAVAGLALTALIKRLIKKDALPQPAIYPLLTLTAITMTGYLLVERLSVIIAFFLAILAGALISKNTKHTPKAFVSKALPILLVLVCIAIEAGETLYPKATWYKASIDRHVALRYEEIPYPLTHPADTHTLIRWLRTNTPADAVLLAAFETSPVLLVWTGKPVILHPKFESPSMRTKSISFLSALYSSEDALYALSQTWHADYLVYQTAMLLDTTKEYYRYMAAQRSVGADTAAYRLHFQPDKLSYFALQYQNPSFRVFKIVNKNTRSPEAMAYSPIYDLKNFSTDDDLASPLSSRAINIFVVNSARQIQLLSEAKNALLGNDFKKAGDLLTQCKQSKIRNPQVDYYLGVLYEKIGNRTLARSSYQEALATEPLYSDAYGALGILDFEDGSFSKAANLFEHALKTRKSTQLAQHHKLETILFNLGLSYYKTNQTQKAINALRETLRLNPNDRTAEQILNSLINNAHSN